MRGPAATSEPTPARQCAPCPAPVSRPPAHLAPARSAETESQRNARPARVGRRVAGGLHMRLGHCRILLFGHGRPVARIGSRAGDDKLLYGQGRLVAGLGSRAEAPASWEEEWCEGDPNYGMYTGLGGGGTAGGGGTYGPSGARPIPIGGTTGPWGPVVQLPKPSLPGGWGPAAPGGDSWFQSMFGGGNGRGGLFGPGANVPVNTNGDSYDASCCPCCG